MNDMYKFRKLAEQAEKQARELYNLKIQAEKDKFEAEKQIWSMPCDTVGWTDEELSHHIFHMHDDGAYVHVYQMPRKLLEQIHELVMHIKRRPRSEDYD